MKRIEDSVFKKGVLLNKCSLSIKQGNCIVPEGVTSIGKYCFEQHSLLTSIQLASTLKSIGDKAFSYTNLSTITIPEGVTSIGGWCFCGCSSMSEAKLPSTLVSIGGSAFEDTNISTIIIPEGVTKYECTVPLFIKNVLKKKGIECPNYYLDKEDIGRKEA